MERKILGMSAANERLVVFVPSLKALDAFIPLVCGFCRNPNYEVLIVITEPSLESFVNSDGQQPDIRIQFLRSIPQVRIRGFSEFLETSGQSSESALSKAFERIVQETFSENVSRKFIFSTSANSIELFFAASAKIQGIKSILLADSMYPIDPSNRRTRYDSGKESKLNLEPEDYSLFDSILLPHKYAAESLGRVFPLSRIQLVGSNRFSTEWVNYWMQLCGGIAPTRPLDSLSVTFLLRPHSDAIFWQEIVRTVQLLRTLYAASCTIQIHTDDAFLSTEELGLCYPWLHEINGQVTIQPGTIPAIYSIARSDLVIDTATSSAFEALALGIPVVQFKYLQAFRPLLSGLFPPLSLKCRDDLLAYLKHTRRPKPLISAEMHSELHHTLIGRASLEQFVNNVSQL
jgi:hypothetical protein